VKGVGEVIAAEHNLFVIKTNHICGLTVSRHKKSLLFGKDIFTKCASCEYRNRLHLSLNGLDNNKILFVLHLQSRM